MIPLDPSRSAIPGELREWLPDSGRVGTFMVVEVNQLIVYVILQNGRRDGYFRGYLEAHSDVKRPGP